MHYYQHNIADYRKDTSHLTLVEHGIYRQLLDSYYLDEQPLSSNLDKLMRTHSIRSADEKQSLCNVLNDFFELTEDGYIHKRCDEVIAEYHGKSDKARASAKARWANKHNAQSDSNANALRTQSEGNANHKPITNNHIVDAPKVAKGTRWSKNLPMQDDWIEYCVKTRPDLNPKDTFESFTDYWVSVAGAKGVKLDWSATWRNWVRGQRTSNKPMPPKNNQFAGAI